MLFQNPAAPRWEEEALSAATDQDARALCVLESEGTGGNVACSRLTSLSHDACPPSWQEPRHADGFRLRAKVPDLVSSR